MKNKPEKAAMQSRQLARGWGYRNCLNWGMNYFQKPQRLGKGTPPQVSALAPSASENEKCEGVNWYKVYAKEVTSAHQCYHILDSTERGGDERVRHEQSAECKLEEVDLIHEQLYDEVYCCEAIGVLGVTEQICESDWQRHHVDANLRDDT